jgi:hypothetical protein
MGKSFSTPQEVSMFSKIRSFFASSVDSLVADIEARVAKLQIVADAHKAEAEVHQKVIEERQALVAFVQKEEARARIIAAKFQALISAF